MKRSLLDAAPFMESETAGGVMTKLIEAQTFATQVDNQTGFSVSFFTGRAGHAGCTNEGFRNSGLFRPGGQHVALIRPLSSNTIWTNKATPF